MTENSSHELAVWFAQLLDRKGGRSVQVLDLRKLSSVTDYFVVASANSLKHLETLVDAPLMELKKSDRPVGAVEGLGTSWVVADFNDVMIHVFDDESRAYYDLEGLWKSAPRVDWAPKRLSLSVAL